MIEKMNKVTVVCLGSDREATVDKLADLGIVHVVEINPPRSAELDQLVTERDRAQRALLITQGRNVEEADKSGRHDTSPEVLVREVIKASERLDDLHDKISSRKRDREAVEPWGSFSRDTLHQLTSAGLQVKLCSALENQLPKVQGAASLHVVAQRRKRVYFAVIAPPSVELGDDLPEIAMPDETRLDALDDEIEHCERVIRKQEKHLDDLAGAESLIEHYLHDLTFRLSFARARDSMGETERLAYLQGFVPVRLVDRLQTVARHEGWALQVREPDPDTEDVPTKISLPRWVEPIRLVFKAMGIVPGYKEIDISPWFMIFLSIFFALLFGDAGYGALFLVGTLVVRKLMPRAPSQPFWLAGVFSVCTIAWGVLTGTYFGVQPRVALLPATVVAYFRSDENVMRLCFLLGAVHLTIAHCWNALIYGKSPKVISELAWAAVLWGNFFLARLLVLGESPSPRLLMALYVPGLAGIVFFSKPSRNPLKLIGGGVGALLLGAVNSFVDVISYIRLYAVGSATVAVASSFNGMAFSMPSWATYTIGILILLLGHSLNVVLGAMSVLVHGVRLNVLEFSQHLGMEWKGHEYKPLTRPFRAESNVEG